VWNVNKNSFNLEIDRKRCSFIFNFSRQISAKKEVNLRFDRTAIETLHNKTSIFDFERVRANITYSCLALQCSSHDYKVEHSFADILFDKVIEGDKKSIGFCLSLKEVELHRVRSPRIFPQTFSAFNNAHLPLLPLDHLIKGGNRR
jgi:hypothetical protein